MKNRKVRNFEIVVAVAAMLLATAAISMATTDNVSAYKKTQATAQANECGNGDTPIDVFCQNLASQIQGDHNSVAMSAEQGAAEEPTPPTPTACADCFDTRPNGPFPPGLLTQLEDFLAETTPTIGGVEVSTVAELCDAIEAAAATATPVTVGEIEELLNDALPGNAAPPVIARVIACLLELDLIVEV
jgi:hypothetical protein